MWGSHRSARDGVGGILAADPGGKNAETWGKDVVALSVVGEVCAGIIKSRSSDSDSLLSSCWGVVARVGVVVTGSNSEVDTSINSPVNSAVKSW